MANLVVMRDLDNFWDSVNIAIIIKTTPTNYTYLKIFFLGAFCAKENLPFYSTVDCRISKTDHIFSGSRLTHGSDRPLCTHNVQDKDTDSSDLH